MRSTQEPEPEEGPKAFLGGCGLTLDGNGAGSAGRPKDVYEVSLSLSCGRTLTPLCPQLGHQVR